MKCMQAGEGGVPAGDNLTIRGFSARTDIFIDGFRDFGGYSRDPFNVEQVEVAKGPASSIAGRGSKWRSITVRFTPSPEEPWSLRSIAETELGPTCVPSSASIGSQERSWASSHTPNRFWRRRSAAGFASSTRERLSAFQARR